MIENLEARLSDIESLPISEQIAELAKLVDELEALLS